MSGASLAGAGSAVAAVGAGGAGAGSGDGAGVLPGAAAPGAAIRSATSSGVSPCCVDAVAVSALVPQLRQNRQPSPRPAEQLLH